jgi:hypothetical protein
MLLLPMQTFAVQPCAAERKSGPCHLATGLPLLPEHDRDATQIKGMRFIPEIYSPDAQIINSDAVVVECPCSPTSNASALEPVASGCHRSFFAPAVTYETRGRDRETPFHICKNYIRRRTPLSKIYAVPLIFRALTRSTHCPFRHRIDQGERLMLDVILLALGLGFFAFLVVYGIASEKL